MVIFVKKLLYLLFLSLSISAADLLPLFTYKTNVWEKTKEQVVHEIMRPSQFKWVEESVSGNAVQTSSFGGIKSYETIIHFDAYKLSRFTFSLYNRGDAVELSALDFSALKYKVSKLIQKVAGRVKPKTENRRIKHTYTETCRWESRFSSFILTAAKSKKQKIDGMTIPERAEFLKLTIIPRKNGTASSMVKKVPLKEKVVRTKSGDIEIVGIPMVDQGQKGYCAVATVERVMRFYSLDVDQHQLAQLANSSAERGTSRSMMHEILKKVGVKLRIKIKSLIEFDIRDIEKIARNYNKVAKKNGGVELNDLRSYYSHYDLYYAFRDNLDDFVESMQKHSDFKKFKREIQKNIQEGKPVLWSCMLGVVKEGAHLPQATGGHMRLIQGYNFSKEGEETIIYSDSWGQDHGRKVMKLQDAWAITLAISVITAR